jgi:hypothetical protein
LNVVVRNYVHFLLCVSIVRSFGVKRSLSLDEHVRLQNEFVQHILTVSVNAKKKQSREVVHCVHVFVARQREQAAQWMAHEQRLIQQQQLQQQQQLMQQQQQQQLYQQQQFQLVIKGRLVVGSRVTVCVSFRPHLATTATATTHAAAARISTTTALPTAVPTAAGSQTISKEQNTRRIHTTGFFVQPVGTVVPAASAAVPRAAAVQRFAADTVASITNKHTIYKSDLAISLSLCLCVCCVC